MKLNYEVAEMEVVAFEAEDVIATSKGLNFGGEGSGGSSAWPA